MFITEHEREEGAEWIKASEAVKVVGKAIDCKPEVARDFLIKRAAAGKILTRCALMKIIRKRGRTTSSEHEDTLISYEYWDEFFHPAKRREQNWIAGDFTISSSDRWGASTVVMIVGSQFSHRDIRIVLESELHAARPSLATLEPVILEISKRSSGGRVLEHDHPYVAARAALELMDIPEAERERLTAPSVGKTMERYYRLRNKRGKAPHEDNLDALGRSLLDALWDHWRG